MSLLRNVSLVEENLKTVQSKPLPSEEMLSHKESRQELAVSLKNGIGSRLLLLFYLFKQRKELELGLWEVWKLGLNPQPFWKRCLFRFPNSCFKDAIWSRLNLSARFQVNRILVFHKQKGTWSITPVDIKQYLSSHADKFYCLDAIYYKVKELFQDQLKQIKYFEIDGLYHTQAKAYYKQEILNSKEVIELINHNSDFSPEEASKLVHKYIDEIICDRKLIFAKMAVVLTRTILKKFFKDVKVAGLEKLRELDKHFQIVYLPAHRSHIDFMAISTILYLNGIKAPYIAASHHLNFFPANLLRKVSGYFIRREKMDAIYNAVLYQYVATLHRHAFSQMVFVEGTRSKTGETLQPKTGIVSQYINAYLEHKTRPVVFIPVSISYDFVLEGDSYLSYILNGKQAAAAFSEEHQKAYLSYKEQRKQLSLGQKIRNFITLIKSPESKGNAYFNFGDAIYLDQVITSMHPSFEKKPIIREKAIPDKWIRDIARVIVKQACIEINTIAPVTSVSLVATALLSSQEKALTENELRAFVNESFMLCRRLFDQVPFEMENNPDLKLDSLPYLNRCRRQRERRSHAGCPSGPNKRSRDRRVRQKIFITPIDQLRYAYNKNNVIHRFVIPSLIAKALQLSPEIRKEELQAYLLENYPTYKDRYHLKWQYNEVWQIAQSFISLWEKKQYLRVSGDMLSVNHDYDFPEKIMDLYSNILGVDEPKTAQIA